MENDEKQQQDMTQQSSIINSARINRNVLERNRRILMNNLLSNLFSLVPQQYTQLSVPDSVDQATTYIKELEKKIERLRERKELILKGDIQKFDSVLIDINSSESSESIMEVSIISGLKKNFLLHQVISVLVDEGAEVVNITYHKAADRVFHTIYSKAICTRIGIETSRVNERLKKLIS